MLCRYCPTGAQAASLFRFLAHTVSTQHTHTHSVGHLWTSDELVAKAATCTTHNKHKSKIHVLSGIRTHNPSQERPQPCALDRAATGLGDIIKHLPLYFRFKMLFVTVCVCVCVCVCARVRTCVRACLSACRLVRHFKFLTSSPIFGKLFMNVWV
jgi:hypothetical protein